MNVKRYNPDWNTSTDVNGTMEEDFHHGQYVSYKDYVDALGVIRKLKTKIDKMKRRSKKFMDAPVSIKKVCKPKKKQTTTLKRPIIGDRIVGLDGIHGTVLLDDGLGFLVQHDKTHSMFHSGAAAMDLPEKTGYWYDYFRKDCWWSYE